MMTVGRRILGLPFLAFGALILSLTATPARADPCEGRLPSRAGEPFSGTVRYVGDGDGLCVGRSGDPDSWIEVRLADFDAPELNASDGRRSKTPLEQVAMGQPVTCEARCGRSGRVIVYDRVIAVCRVRGRAIGDLLRALRAPEGGN